MPERAKPPFFVNLPIRYISTGKHYLETFLEHGIHPELGLDSTALEQLSPRWHTRLARTLTDAGLTCSIHLPFFDLHPGSHDSLIAAATRQRLIQGLEIASIYDPAHMVGHAHYSDVLYAGRAMQWLQHSEDTWREILGTWPGHPPLFLENVYETMPESLAALLDTLSDLDTGLCLDVGHWFSFGRGRWKRNLGHWLDTLGKYLRHMHMHDNNGEMDGHLGLGQGLIDFDELFAELISRKLKPSMTMEPHTEEDFFASLEFTSAHPSWFNRR